MIECKRWKQLVPPGAHHHLAIIPFTPRRAAHLHTHDFPEVFWVESGKGLHRINGLEKRLNAGDLVFVRAEDEHCLKPVDSAGFTLVNLAFDPRVREGLLQRHPRELASLFAPKGPLPCRRELPATTIALLRHQVDALERAEDSAALLEHFLLGLYQQTIPVTDASLPPMPDWLNRACDLARNPDVFSRGAAGFVQAAGRSPEHVARTVRAVLRQTPSDYVNEIRMEHAARELRVTSRPIAQIALDCGIGNLSHFYCLFRAAHGLTPRTYRLTHYRTMA